MQCSVCGSQDTTPKQGISKSGKNAGQPWKAYDCNEPQCKNEKGYPSRTFVPMARPKAPVGNSVAGNSAPAVSGNLEKKIDRILAILEKNLGKTVEVQDDSHDLPF